MIFDADCITLGMLFWFSIAFSLLGVVLMVMGGMLQAMFNYEHAFVDYSFFSASSLLIMVGIIIFIVAFFGCCGALKENRCMITTFSICLLALFIVEISFGIACYNNKNLEADIESRFNETFQLSPTQKEFEKTWDIMQHELQCCGVNSAEDWYQIGNKTIPDSCCKELSFDDDKNLRECSQQDAFTKGCFSTLMGTLQQKSSILIAVFVGMAVFQVFVVMFAWGISRKMRREYQTV